MTATKRVKRGLPYRPMVPDITYQPAPHGAWRATRRDAAAVVWKVGGHWHGDAEFPDGRRAAVVRDHTVLDRGQAAATALQVAERGASPHWPFGSLAAARWANAEAGQRFFTATSLAVYRTEVVREFGLIAGRYFVTCDVSRGQRRFSVRRVWPDGSVDTVGTFMGYVSRWGARDRAVALADADLRTETP